MFYIVQAGNTLQVLAAGGAVVQDITLPTGVTMVDTVRARFAVSARKLVVSNAVSKNIWIDPTDFSAFILAITGPTVKPTLAAGVAGILSGTYTYWYTFVHKIGGIVVDESPFSPLGTVGVVAQKVNGSALQISADSQVTGRRVYRSTTNGAVPFFAFDIDDNTTTTFTDNLADASLSLVASDSTQANAQAGSDGASKMRLLTAWKGRLFGVSDQAALVDHALYTEENKIWGWSLENDFPIDAGEDKAGITGFLPRRDSLGIAKQNRLVKLIGSSNSDFQIIHVWENVGVIASDSIQIIRDTAYFLAADGVYSWDDNDGVKCLSRDKVDPWFTKDETFDRNRFPDAVGGWNPSTNCYELLLVPAGGDDLTVWVAVELTTGQWFGPHLTTAFTPTMRSLFRDDNAVLRPVMGGSDGYIYLQNRDGGRDLPGPGNDETDAVAITADAMIAWLTQGNPDLTHFWGRLTLLSRLETNGQLTIIPTVGRLDSNPSTGQVFDLTLGRQIQDRLGVGPLATLRFLQDAVGEQFLAYGIEITNVSTRGRR